tara:strand:+ start:22918 stop:24399 length:1482 start_codon:yes stop_codon:yes gene_type:complete
MTQTNRLSNIAVLLNAQYRHFFVMLSRELKKCTGADIHLYCNSDDQVRYMDSISPAGTFASINDAGVLNRALEDRNLDAGAVYRRAHDVETRLDVTINQLALTNRHLGRGYSMTGVHHPRSRQSETASYTHMVHAVVSEVEYWSKQLSERDIDLVINGGPTVCEVARAQGVPFRYLLGSRTKNLHYWATACTGENPAVSRAFHGQAGEESQALLDAPYDSHMSLRTRFLRGTTLTGTVRRIARAIANQVGWTIRRESKARQYFLTSIIRHHIRRWRDYRKLQRLATTTLESLEGVPFVFFPLQTEPETSLQWMSPEFMYQHAAIVALSRDLPANVRLVVKDTYEALGRRPVDFYSQLQDLKNAVLLDPLELGLKVVEKSSAVATICSTAGFEAAVMGKPVIVFGRHNVYDFLPHVQVTQDLCDLRGVISKALAEDFDLNAAKHDGQRFLHAVTATSFDMRDYDLKDLEKFDPAIVEDSVVNLLAGLEFQNVAA